MKAWQDGMAELLGWELRQAMAAAARIECFRVRIDIFEFVITLDSFICYLRDLSIIVRLCK